jgi:hypothetical protein
MTIHLNRQTPSTTTDQRRPTIPVPQSANLFLGWGPKL